MALNNQLLNHFTDKFGVVTVVNATFYAVDDDVPLISFDTLKMSNITSEGQQKEIRGGQGAELLLQYDFGRTANVEITDALVSMGSLEYLWGGTLSTGDITYLRRTETTILGTKDFDDNYVISMPTDYRTDAAETFEGQALIVKGANKYQASASKWITYKIDGTVETLGLRVGSGAALPSSQGSYTEGDFFFVTGTNTLYILGTVSATYTSGDWDSIGVLGATQPTTGFLTNAGKYYVNALAGSATKLYILSDIYLAIDKTDNAGPVAYEVNNKVTLFYKGKNTVGNGIQQMILSATDFPPTVRMVGETIVLDADKGEKVAFQIEIPKLKLDANFTFTLDAEGDPSVFDFSGVALSHNGQILIARTLGTI
jgi:hypothetical protein